jgi:alkylation response protein AidB-like acyl-CoA dehydrogenase
MNSTLTPPIADDERFRTLASPEADVDLETLLERAHAIGERAAGLAGKADREHKLDDSIVEDMNRARLMQVLQPRRWGGLEMGFPAQVRISQALAQHDVATSWVYSILSIHHWWGAFATPEMQAELWREDPHLLFSDVFAPTGKAEAVEDGYLLSGEWKFSSGVLWSQWVALGVMLDNGGEPDYRMMFVPKSECEVLDDWDTLGMRGTGSCGVRVERRFVPEYRTLSLFPMIASGTGPGNMINPGPLYRMPFGPGICLSLMGCSVGGAQGMLRLMTERMKSRTPTFTVERQDQMGHSQIVLAHNAVRVTACEHLLYSYADELSRVGETLAAGGEIDVMELRTRLFGWRAFMSSETRAAATALFENAGASSIYADSPIQRFWRDIHSIAQHVVQNYEVGMRNYGRFLLGQEPLPSIY